MKSSQLVFLGLALIVGAQYSSATHYNQNCGLGPGKNPCSCSEIVVKAAKPFRPVKFVDPALITEANAARTASSVTYKGCGSHSSASSGISVYDLLKPSCGPIAPKFEPIHNLCHKPHRPCAIAEVTPAYPVTPTCSTCHKQVCSCEAARDAPCSYCGSRHGCSCAYSELQKFPEDEGLSFDEQESIYNGNCAPAAPADPVSLALAYGYAQKRANCIPEAKLSLGHTSIPIDGSVRQTYIDIPEEKLLTVERPIVELKYSPKCPSRAKYDELVAQQEALEAQRLELESQARSDDPSEIFISYSDIGYGPVAPSKNQFVNSEAGSAASSYDPTLADDTPCGQLGTPIPGYRSGNVIVRHDPDQYDEYEADNISYDPDSSSEEAEQYSAGVGLLARLKARAQSCGCSK